MSVLDRELLEALRAECGELDAHALAALVTPISDDVKHRIATRAHRQQRRHRTRRTAIFASALAACALAFSVAQPTRAEQTAEAARLTREAESLREQARYEQAVERLQRALELRESALGREHIEVAANLTELAEIYRTQRLTAKAEPLYRRAFAIQPTAVF